MAEVTLSEPHFLRDVDGLKSLPPARKAAWTGLLQLHADLTRALGAELSRRHNIGVRAYSVLEALAQAEERHLRISKVAEQGGLSISRASRLIDQLEAQGLVARASCAEDSRVVHVGITDAGCKLLCEAQDTFLEIVEDRYLGRLSCDEIEQIGTLFSRLAD